MTGQLTDYTLTNCMENQKSVRHSARAEPRSYMDICTYIDITIRQLVCHFSSTHHQHKKETDEVLSSSTKAETERNPIQSKKKTNCVTLINGAASCRRRSIQNFEKAFHQP